MSRLIFVPQYPSKMRYQEWWLKEFPKEFEKRFDEVVILGLEYLEGTLVNVFAEDRMFSPIDEAMSFETYQMGEYMALDIRDDDILFLADISFPGIFPSVLYHKRCPKMYAYCHATAKQRYDYFMPVRKQKFASETALSKLFDKIFFATNYHRNMVMWDNIKVVGLPEVQIRWNPLRTKVHDVVSVCRPTPQKVNMSLEKKVAKKYNFTRHQSVSWARYSDFLSESKILLITSKADTFNYTILDAVACNCVPIAPNKLCFPEILPREYLYNSENELYSIIDQVLSHDLGVPEIRCQERVDEFYDTICNVMKGNI